MKILLAAAMVAFPVVVFAQSPVPTVPASPEMQATEQMLLEQMNARRTWQALAIARESENADLKKQLVDAKRPPDPAAK